MEKENAKNSKLQANKLRSDSLKSVVGGAGEREEFIKEWTNPDGSFKEDMIGSYMQELGLSRDEAIKQLKNDYNETLKWLTD